MLGGSRNQLHGVSKTTKTLCFKLDKLAVLREGEVFL